MELTLTTTLVAILLLGIIVYQIYQFTIDPLRSVPGPFVARFTQLWEAYHVSKGHFEQVEIQLHKRYGSIVRLSPTRYSISDLQAVKQIYAHGAKYPKSAFYSPFGNPHPDLRDLFSDQNVDTHSQRRRGVSSLYSMTTLLSYESFVDASNAELCARLASFVETRREICVPIWTQYYAFDVIGAITVGESFGYMRHETDPTKVLQSVHDSMAYGSVVGLFPALHPWLAWAARTAKQRIPFDNILDFLNAQQDKRKTHPDSGSANDFLSKLLLLREKGKLTSHDVTTTLGANVAAGSDTTAISLSSVIYHLMHSPSSQAKLVAEIDTLASQNKISNPVKFREAQEMPYLQAVIKEALRMHPATGQMLSRVVPPEGALLAGFWFPGGSVVGCNPWVTHLDTTVFGADAAQFNPDRWLGKPEKVAEMERNMFTFGAGARTCIGKNISLLEMTKLIPQIYRSFEFEMVGGGEKKEWTTETVWFVKQKFDCTVSLRRK